MESLWGSLEYGHVRENTQNRSATQHAKIETHTQRWLQFSYFLAKEKNMQPGDPEIKEKNILL
jgi:hypothetical protein